MSRLERYLQEQKRKEEEQKRKEEEKKALEFLSEYEKKKKIKNKKI